MLNVSRLKSVTDQTADLESRCRSIARNAVQASREAHGRGNSLYTDDEAKRERMIEQILHLDMTKYSNDADSVSLVSQVQPVNPVIDRISEILEKGLEDELLRQPEAETVAVNLPKSKKENEA